VVILGEGPERGRLARDAARLGVAGRLHLVGARADVPRWLASADRFVHPSVEEGLGQAVLEAGFAGAPIVTTSAGGLAELALGRMCAPADAGALAEAICAPPVRADRAALARFTAEQMAARTWEVYQQVAGSRERLPAGRRGGGG
jgi:glycosyltransferase involved in cell wall biosynthesis